MLNEILFYVSSDHMSTASRWKKNQSRSQKGSICVPLFYTNCYKNEVPLNNDEYICKTDRGPHTGPWERDEARWNEYFRLGLLQTAPLTAIFWRFILGSLYSEAVWLKKHKNSSRSCTGSPLILGNPLIGNNIMRCELGISEPFMSIYMPHNFAII